MLFRALARSLAPEHTLLLCAPDHAAVLTPGESVSVVFPAALPLRESARVHHTTPLQRNLAAA